MSQTLRLDAERVRRAGRFGDSVLAHITPSQSDLLMLNGGSGTINPETGLKEHFSFKNILSALAPAALSIFAPGIGSALGGALGATGATANILGNALVGGGLGAITGGKRGALTGALTSGAFSAASESGLFKGIGDSLGFGSTPDASGAASGGSSGSGEFDASGRDILKTEVMPASGGQTPLQEGGLPQLPSNQVLASLSTPGDADTFLASQQVANAQMGSPAGAGGLPPDWAVAARPEMAPSRQSFFEKNKTPLLMGAGLLALNGLGGEAQAQQQGAAAAPQGGSSWGGPAPKYELDREQIPLTDAELRMFGQTGGGARTGRFFTAPNRYKAMQEGGKVKRPSRDDDARNDPLRRNPPKVRNADDPDYEKTPAYPGLEQFRKPGAWRGDDIFPNSKPASRKEYADGGSVKAAAERVAAAGRGGDTMLAHINPEEQELLLRHGGSGTVNPKTGLLEFSDVGVGDGPGMGAPDPGWDGGGGLPDLGPAIEVGTVPGFQQPDVPYAGPEAFADYQEDAQAAQHQERSWGRKAVDYVGHGLRDAMNNPFSTLANIALSAVVPGYALANAVTGLVSDGRSLAGLGVDAARSMVGGIGAPAATGVTATDVALQGPQQGPLGPVSPDGNNGRQDFAQAAVQAAGQGATPASATIAGDQAAQAANGWGRTALDNSNVDWTTFGQSGGGRGAGMFYDAPGMRAMEAGGKVSDGRSDDIPAVLSEDEHIFTAEEVAMLGNGSPAAGHKRLEGMRANIRKHKGAALAKGKISPDAKPPAKYLPKLKRGIAA